MNNAKASNVILAMADATASMAADYEQQIAGLKQTNEALVQRTREQNDQITKANAVFERMLRAPESFMWPIELLNDWPWPVPILNRLPNGSPGPQSTPPTSKGSSPSE